MCSHSLLQRNLPNPGLEPRSPELQADSLLIEPPGKLHTPRAGRQSLNHWTAREFPVSILFDHKLLVTFVQQQQSKQNKQNKKKAGPFDLKTLERISAWESSSNPGRSSTSFFELDFLHPTVRMASNILIPWLLLPFQFSSVQFSRSVVSDSSQPHE